MKRKVRLVIAIQATLMLLLMGCVSPRVVTEVTTGVATDGTAGAPLAVLQGRDAGCAAPDATNAATCGDIEAAILASTVRLELTRLGVDGNGYYEPMSRGASHATVVAGRYLLTHDHFGIDPSDPQVWRDLSITVYRADGQLVLQDVPYGAFVVAAVSPGTLLFDFRERGGAGLFEVLGLPSAPIDVQQAAQVQAGDVVAQVNWDGRDTHVDWVLVKEVRAEDGIPMLILDNFVEPGASGGGIYLYGSLLANNWFRRTERTPEGQVLQQYTAAALNTVTLPATSEASLPKIAAAPALTSSPDVVEMEGGIQLR